VSLLSKEPGSPESKLAWLTPELPVIELLAMEDHPTDQDRRRAAIRSRVLRHYRHHLRRPQANLGSAPAVAGSRAERRARAQLMYSVETLLPEPSEEALAKWEAAGSPHAKAWWLPESDRARLVKE
jgi:hypothetical protein